MASEAPQPEESRKQSQGMSARVRNTIAATALAMSYLLGAGSVLLWQSQNKDEKQKKNDGMVRLEGDQHANNVIARAENFVVSHEKRLKDPKLDIDQLSMLNHQIVAFHMAMEYFLARTDDERKNVKKFVMTLTDRTQYYCELTLMSYQRLGYVQMKGNLRTKIINLRDRAMKLAKQSHNRVLEMPRQPRHKLPNDLDILAPLQDVLETDSAMQSPQNAEVLPVQPPSEDASLHHLDDHLAA